MEQSNNGLDITCAEEFAAPVQDLYAAWTEEAQLKQWWHPMGNTLDSYKADIKSGGEVRYVFHPGSDAAAIEISGTYKVAEPQRRLEYSWNWKLPEADAVGDASFVLSISFEEKENGSRIEVVQKGFTDEASVQPHKDGWKSGLAALKEYLEGRGGNRTASAEGKGEEASGTGPEDAPAATRSGGYNEAPDQVRVGGGNPE